MSLPVEPTMVCSFCTMVGMVENSITSFYYEGRATPMAHMRESRTSVEPLPAPEGYTGPNDRERFLDRLLLVEKAMSGFLTS